MGNSSSSRRGERRARRAESIRTANTPSPASNSETTKKAVVRMGPDIQCHICCNHGGDVVIPAAKITHSCPYARTVCESCLKNHIKHAIMKQAYFNIPCICTSGDHCKTKLKYRHIQRYADTSDFNTYDEGILQECLESDPEFRWCSATGCGSGQLHVRQDSYPRMRCHECRQCTCFTHRCPWHSGRTCEQYDRDASASEEVALLQNLEGSNFRRCPKCGHGIEKNKGCSHMTCRCKYEFCWHCMAPYGGTTGIHKVGRKGHKQSCVRYGN